MAVNLIFTCMAAVRGELEYDKYFHEGNITVEGKQYFLNIIMPILQQFRFPKTRLFLKG